MRLSFLPSMLLNFLALMLLNFLALLFLKGNRNDSIFSRITTIDQKHTAGGNHQSSKMKLWHNAHA